MDDAPTRSHRRILLSATGLVVLVVLLVALNFFVSHMRSTLRDESRYRLDFGAIVCEPAPPVPPKLFLSEVQYLADRPDAVSILEPDLASRLAAAFARHPWVEAVEQVEVRAPRAVSVRLRYRQPVLTVVVGDRVRAVDAGGVLLPTSARTDGLPRYEGKAQLPAGPAGMPWGDAAVEAAARRVGSQR